LLRARLEAGPGRSADAPQLLLKAANRLEPLHVGLEREAYRDASSAVLSAGRLAVRGGLLEVAARTGQPERAANAMRHLSEATTTAGSDWALGTLARSRALLSDGESAECSYREAIDRLGRTRVRVELARAHLVYGEWLRRQSRRVDARDQLPTAYEMLTAMGTDGFAERARRELLATRETVRKRTAETVRQLTVQEAQIARLAGEGIRIRRSAPGCS
jgi:hypothetical protein